MTFLAFLHGYAGTVPKGSFDFGFFIFVVSAGAKRCAQVVLVLSQSFEHDGGDAQVLAEVSACTLGVALGKVPHDFETFIRALIRIGCAHVLLGGAYKGGFGLRLSKLSNATVVKLYLLLNSV